MDESIADLLAAIVRQAALDYRANRAYKPGEQNAQAFLAEAGLIAHVKRAAEQDAKVRTKHARSLAAGRV